jgi:hypothetical protein
MPRWHRPEMRRMTEGQPWLQVILHSFARWHRPCVRYAKCPRPIGNTDSGDGSGAMREHLKGFDRVFDTEDMQILAAAFDSAWEAVQASGVRYPEDKVELVRAILAKHIIAAAKDGERDHSRLRDGALLALAQTKIS